MALSTRVITTGLNTLAISSPSILQENAKPLETTNSLRFGWSPSTRQATQHLKPCHRHELCAHKQLAATWTEKSSRRRSKPNPDLMGNPKPRSLDNSDNVVSHHKNPLKRRRFCRSSTDFSKVIKWRPWPAFCAPASKMDDCYKVLQWNTGTFNPSWAQQPYQWNKYCDVFAVAGDVWGSKWFFNSIAMCLFRYNCTVNHFVNALSQSLGESLVITCENMRELPQIFPRFWPQLWIQTKPRAFVLPCVSQSSVLTVSPLSASQCGKPWNPTKIPY